MFPFIVCPNRWVLSYLEHALIGCCLSFFDAYMLHSWTETFKKSNLMCFFVIKIQVISFEVWSLKKAKKRNISGSNATTRINIYSAYLSLQASNICLTHWYQHWMTQSISGLKLYRYVKGHVASIFIIFYKNNDFDAKANQYVLNCVY